MKKCTFTLLTFLCFFLFNTNFLSAQNSAVHHIKVIVNDGTVDWEMDGMVANFGPRDFTSMTGDLVWVDDGITAPTDGDSWSEIGQYGCDSLINGTEIDGNIALISRGACEFGTKLLNAQNQGAVAGIIGNRAPIGLDAGSHSNGLVWMAGGADGGSVTIPAIFINYEDRAVLGALLENGPVNITIEHSYMYDAAVSYQYATPLDQVKPLEDIQLIITNWDTLDLYNVSAICTITSPSGVETVLTEVADTLFNARDFALLNGDGLSAETQFIFEEGYTPTEVGTYTAVFTATTEDGTHGLDSESITATFAVSENTFMMDNGNVVNTDGFALNLNSFFNDTGVNGQFGMGNFFRTGADGTAVAASFAIANPSGLADITFELKVYNADLANDGTLDNDASGTVTADDLTEDALLTQATYTFTGNESPHQLITLNFDIPATLNANGIYLVIAEANGALGFVPPAFTTAGGGNYPDFASAYRAGMVYEADGLEDWNDVETVLPGLPHGGRHPVVRLHMDGFVSTDDLGMLDQDKFKVYPTVTRDLVNLEIDLDQISEVVKIKITDINGQFINSKLLQNVQKDLMQFDISNYPAGTYYFNIETREGQASQAFMKQ